MTITEAVTGVVSGLISPVTDILKRKQEKQIARDAFKAKLSEAKLANVEAGEQREHSITLSETDWEKIAVGQTERSWKDEYVVLSLVGIINAIMLGGILHGFGFTAFLSGVLIGVNALSTLIELKFLMTAAVLSSLGVSVWKWLRA